MVDARENRRPTGVRLRYGAAGVGLAVVRSGGSRDCKAVGTFVARRA